MSRTLVVLLLVAVIAYANAVPQDSINSNCGPNEVFKACGTACEPTCANPQVGSCTPRCVPSCQCMDGYVRNYQNRCVLVRDC